MNRAKIPWRAKNAPINTNIQQCRSSIPGDFLSILRFLNQHGWGLHYKTHSFLRDDGIGVLEASRLYRGAVSTASFEYGYFTQNTKSDVIHNARRLAELCLQINEQLPFAYPSRRVADNGYLYPDYALTKAAHTSAQALYDYESQTSRQNLRKGSVDIYLSLGFLHISSERLELLIGKSELSQLKEFMNDNPCC